MKSDCEQGEYKNNTAGVSQVGTDERRHGGLSDNQNQGINDLKVNKKANKNNNGNLHIFRKRVFKQKGI